MSIGGGSGPGPGGVDPDADVDAIAESLEGFEYNPDGGDIGDVDGGGGATGPQGTEQAGEPLPPSPQEDGGGQQTGGQGGGGGSMGPGFGGGVTGPGGTEQAGEPLPPPSPEEDGGAQQAPPAEGDQTGMGGGLSGGVGGGGQTGGLGEQIARDLQQAAARGELRSADQRQREGEVSEEVQERRREAVRSATLRDEGVSQFDPQSDIIRRGPGAFEARVQTDSGETTFLPFAFSEGGAQQLSGIGTARAREAGAEDLSEQVPGDVEPSEVRIRDGRATLTESAAADVRQQQAADVLSTQTSLDIDASDIASVSEQGVEFTPAFQDELDVIQEQRAQTARFQAIQRGERLLELQLEQQGLIEFPESARDPTAATWTPQAGLERGEEFVVRDTDDGPQLALTEEFEEALAIRQARESLGQPGFERGDELRVERGPAPETLAALGVAGAFGVGGTGAAALREEAGGLRVELTAAGREAEIRQSVAADISQAEVQSPTTRALGVRDFPTIGGETITDVDQLQFGEEGRVTGAEPPGPTRAEQIAGTEEALRVGDAGTLTGDVTGALGRGAAEVSAGVLGAGEFSLETAQAAGEAAGDVLGPAAGFQYETATAPVDIAFGTDISESAGAAAEAFTRAGTREAATVTVGAPGILTRTGQGVATGAEFTAAAIDRQGVVQGVGSTAGVGGFLAGQAAFRTGEFAIENPASFTGGLAGGAVGGFGLSKALRVGPNLAREASIRARGGSVVDFEDASDPPRLVMDDTLPGFTERAASDPDVARREFESQARETDIAGDEPVAFHGRDPEDVREFGEFGRNFEASEGSSELPGLFQSADLSRLRLPTPAGESPGMRLGIPRGRFGTSRVLAERDVDVAVAEGQTRAQVARFLEQEASREQSFIRGGDVTPEQEVIAPPGSQFQEAGGIFGIRVGGRRFRIPFTERTVSFGGEVVPGRLVERVDADDAGTGPARATDPDAEGDGFLSGEEVAAENVRSIRRAQRRATEPDRVSPAAPVSRPPTAGATSRGLSESFTASDELLSSVAGASEAPTEATGVSEVAASLTETSPTATEPVSSVLGPTSRASGAPSDVPGTSTPGISTPGPTTPGPTTPGISTPVERVPVPGAPPPPPTRTRVPESDFDRPERRDEFRLFARQRRFEADPLSLAEAGIGAPRREGLEEEFGQFDVLDDLDEGEFRRII